MALNMGINFLMGLIPGLGAAGSAFFKSNSRNLQLLTAWQAGNKDKVKRSTLRFYLGILILLALIVLLILIGWAFYAWLFYHFAQTIAQGLGFQTA
jgi:hypothetical protein